MPPTCQVSLEDAAWQHGAFTRALLRLHWHQHASGAASTGSVVQGRGVPVPGVVGLGQTEEHLNYAY
jgi:hypothetical protein